MDATVFLSKLFGYLLILIALHVLFCKKHFRTYMSSMLDNPGVANLMSLITIVMGLLLLLSHNIWTAGGSSIVVTVLCWIVMLRGLYGFFCPEHMAKLVHKFLNSASGLYIAAIINIVIGVFLLINAYAF